MIDTVVAPDSRQELAHRLAVSAASQLVARCAHLVLNVVTSVIVVRYLGSDGYGDYAKVIVIVGWAGLLSDAGLPKVALRIAATDSVCIEDVVGTVTVLRLALSVVGAVVTQGALTLVHASPTVRVAGAVACLMFVVEALLSTTLLFQAALQQQFEGYVRVLMELVEFAMLLVVIFRHGGLVQLFLAPIVGGAVGALVGWLLARRRFGRRPAWNTRLAYDLGRLALPVAPGILLGALTLKLDGVMVAVLGTTREVGAYTAAFQPVEYVFLALGAVVAYPFLPVLSRTHGSDHVTFLATYQRACELVVILTLPVAAVAAVDGNRMIRAVYGPGWQDAVRPFQLLSCALVFMAISGWQGFVLLAGDRQIDSLRYGTVALVASAVMCVVLVPPLGPTGGAIAVLVANIAGMAYSMRIVHTRMRVSLRAPAMARIVAATAVLLGLLALLHAASAPWWSNILAAGPSYVIALWACRVVTAKEVRMLANRAVPGTELSLP
jgi:O-antigen/teichoic acid export membrane protein